MCDQKNIFLGKIENSIIKMKFNKNIKKHQWSIDYMMRRGLASDRIRTMLKNSRICSKHSLPTERVIF